MSQIHTDVGYRPEHGVDTGRPGRDTVSSGALNGAAARAIDQSSLLEDAQEELTSMLSEKVEKDLSKREVEAGRKSDSFERIAKVREIQEMLDTLRDLDKQDMLSSVKRMLRRNDGSSGYREKARKDFDDPAHQYAALSALVEGLKARGASSEDVAEAEKARDDLMAEAGAAIRGALNTGRITAAAADQGLASPPALREVYREHTEDYQDMRSVLKGLSDKFGLDKLPDAIDFMTRALGADMAAAGSSVAKAKLATIVSDLKRIQVVTTILGNANVVAERAQQLGAASSTSGITLLTDLVPLLDKTNARTGDVTAILDKLAMPDQASKINVLTDLKHLADAIPPTAFKSDDGRNNVLGALQNSLDDAIEIEEEQEED